MLIIVSGIPVDVVKKDIKNLHLTVAPPDGAVHVSAPLSMSDDSIERFVRTRLGWIRNQKNKYHQQLRQTERQYVSGETLYVWGKQYFLRVDYSYKGNSVILNGDKAVLTVRKESTAKQREAFINEWYRSLLKAEIERLLPLWEKRTGLKCSSWQTKYMTTKWGTCSKDSGKIWFNLQLAKKPIECLEYVILHELTHLLIDNHGEDFVSYMDAKMPFWRETRKKLNDSIMDYMDSNADIESRE